VGVVTINMARLGYRYGAKSVAARSQPALASADLPALYRELDRLLEIARDTLEVKRTVIQEAIDNGLFPYTQRYLRTLRNHFSTIGVNGINEMIRNLSADEFDITDPEGEQIALDVLDHVRARMVEFQEASGHLYNLEATPAEGTTYRFAKEDRRRFPGILQAGTDTNPYYTNSSQLPVGFTTDPFEAVQRQSELQSRYTGGTVLHLYMGERISSADACRTLVRRVLETSRLPYITITPTFSICPSHGYLEGEQPTCPLCAAEGREVECEVWTRVMGYHRPVASFNIGKKGEHAERAHFCEPATLT
jgi:ribonucleoside-triphosphate reductase